MHRASFAGARAPDRDPAGRQESDVAVHVGVGDVLLRRVEVAEGGDEAGPVPDFREAEAGLQGEVVVAQSGPGEGEHVAGGRGAGGRGQGVVEDRAVPGLAHAHHHVFAVLHLDDLAAHVEGAVAGGCQVAPGIVRIDLLDEEVLDVGRRIGEAPRHPAVVPEHHHRHSREGRAHDVAAGPGQMGEVPDRGDGQTEVGVVREERLAGRAPGSADDPAIRAGMAAPGPECVQQGRRDLVREEGGEAVRPSAGEAGIGRP